MTREEAIRILDPETTGEAMAEIEYYGGFSGRVDVVQAVLDACILAVAALREQEQRRWIPVTEKMPKENHDGSVNAVLVTDGFVQHMAYFARGEWRFAESGEIKEPMWYSITHWMPLPEPPKEE